MSQSSQIFLTPVLLIIFNRPEKTQKIFDKLQIIKPNKLFISADGPRLDRKLDKELCEETRDILEKIDWPCEVYKKYSNTNISCDPHIEKAVSWFFENVEQGIILEDDCIPNYSFFIFCEALLEKYANDFNIMHINGSNFQFGKKRGEGSYYFSQYAHSWGWATWKRAWKHYDSKMQSFSTFEKNNIISIKFSTLRQQIFWLNFFRKLYQGKYSFWDSKWAYTIWSLGGICITPNVNMIANIGHGPGSTHTIFKDKLNQKAEEMAAIIHPLSIDINTNADEATFNVYYYRTFMQKVIYKIFKYIN
jgi:hypothetical protein